MHERTVPPMIRAILAAGSAEQLFRALETKLGPGVRPTATGATFEEDLSFEQWAAGLGCTSRIRVGRSSVTAPRVLTEAALDPHGRVATAPTPEVVGGPRKPGTPRRPEGRLTCPAISSRSPDDTVEGVYPESSANPSTVSFELEARPCSTRSSARLVRASVRLVRVHQPRVRFREPQVHPAFAPSETVEFFTRSKWSSRI